MFPFENSGEISFQPFLGTNNEQEQEDLILHNQLLASINLSNPSTNTTTPTPKGRGRARGRGHARKSWPADTKGGAGATTSGGYAGYDIGTAYEDTDTKKMVHRDVERQRRHDMSALFSTLSSLLPPPYLKGKRSMSDHIAESVHYIQDLQKNVKGLGDRRDKLKVLQDYKSGASIGHAEGSSSSSTTGCNVAVYKSAVGVQVHIVTGGESEDRFALSTALKIIHEEGLSVVSCASNRANEAFFYSILCQVNDTKCVNTDIERLQQRLYGAVY